jgi:hypothetical protein
MAIFNKIIVGTGGCVSCPACNYEISVLKTPTLPREFSALCPNCGARKFYLSAEIHDRTQTKEAVRLSTKIGFGRRTASYHDQTVGSPEEPKSWLGGVASWLLK